MTNIDIVKTLLEGMGNTVEADKALAAACIVLLDEVMTGKEEAKKDKPKAEPKKKANTAHKNIDHGKICATYKAGWPIKEIAKEIGATEGTVRYHLQKEGLIK